VGGEGIGKLKTKYIGYRVNPEKDTTAGNELEGKRR